MPLLRHDLTRTARRGRTHWVRVVYALALLGALFATYASWFGLSGVGGTHALAPKDMSRFAHDFAMKYAVVQFAAVAVLAPALGGAAIADERQRGTLDLLLATGLRSGEIVRAKLLAGLLQLAGVLVVGVPVGAIALLLGGVDWRLLVGTFLLSVAWAASLAALGLAFSARAKSVPAAVTLTYLVGGAMTLATTPIAFISPVVLLIMWSATSAETWLGLALACGVVQSAAAAVLASAAASRLVPAADAREQAVYDAIRTARRTGPTPPRARAADAFTETFEAQRRKVWPPPAGRARAIPVPRVGDRPLVWKETYFGGSAAARNAVRLVGVLAILAIGVGGPLVVGVLNLGANRNLRYDQPDIHGPARFVVLLSLAATVLAVTAFAAGSVASEREAGTLDGLLTLPDGRPPILEAKWLGAVLRGRWPAAAAAVTLMLGVLADAFDPLGAVLAAVRGRPRRVLRQPGHVGIGPRWEHRPGRVRGRRAAAPRDGRARAGGG
ncbi:MAG: ABC transporter permease subunit [Gemmataceae bacterium]